MKTNDWITRHVIGRGKKPGYVVTAETKEDSRGYRTDLRNRREEPEATAPRRRT